MTRTHNAMREFVVPVAVAVAAVVPAMALRLTGGSTGPVGDAALFGLAILAAGFLLSWGAEAAEKYIATGFVLAMVALITVLPEYAVDFYYAYRAGQDPASGYVAYAAANMTGANRLLIGIAWPLIVGLNWMRNRRAEIRLPRNRAVELAFLTLATVYSFVIPLKGTISLLDTVVFVAIFAAYVGSFLMAGGFLVIGACLSALTRSQVVAFVLTATVCVLLILAGQPQVLDFFSGALPRKLVNALAYLSMLRHFEAIARGVLDLRDLAYFVLSTLGWLLAGVLLLELKRVR